MTITDLKFEFKMTSDGDNWGNCMVWLFAIADYQTEFADGPPEAWEFRQSPLGANVEDYTYQTLLEIEPDTDVLGAFGDLLWRYREKLLTAGQDY
jgi:hypothetical protein